MNTTINTAPIAVASNPVTAEMIAKRLGIPTKAVRICMSKNPGTYSKNKVALIRKTAESEEERDGLRLPMNAGQRRKRTIF